MKTQTPAASLRTRRDTAAVHLPPAGARRLPPLALLHPVGRVAFYLAQQFCTAIARLIHAFTDIQAEVVEPQQMRSYWRAALCVNCDAVRTFDVHWYCETCGADSALHRPGYKRGAKHVKRQPRRSVVRVQVPRLAQTPTALRRVQGR